MKSKYEGKTIEDLKAEQKGVKLILNQDPPEWLLSEIEVTEGTELKTVKAARLHRLYELLDLVFESYDIEQKQLQKIGAAITVTVRIWARDFDGGELVREGSGMVDATKGIRNASAMAEALAIKNAAKKFGRVFGRDLYAKQEDEKPKEEQAPESEPEAPEVIDEKSPRGRIILQARKSKTAKGLQKVYTNAKELLKSGEIEPDDTKVFEEITKKAEEIGLKFE